MTSNCKHILSPLFSNHCKCKGPWPVDSRHRARAAARAGVVFRCAAIRIRTINMNATGEHTHFVPDSRIPIHGGRGHVLPLYDWLPAAGMLTLALLFSFCCFTGFFFTGLMARMAISKKIADSAS